MVGMQLHPCWEEWRSQAKLDKTEKLWYIFLRLFRALVPNCAEQKLCQNFAKFSNIKNTVVGYRGELVLVPIGDKLNKEL